MDPWYKDTDRLFEVARFLKDRGELTSVEDTIYFFEKPWKWTADHDEMVMVGFDEHVRSLPKVAA